MLKPLQIIIIGTKHTANILARRLTGEMGSTAPLWVPRCNATINS